MDTYSLVVTVAYYMPEVEATGAVGVSQQVYCWTTWLMTCLHESSWYNCNLQLYSQYSFIKYWHYNNSPIYYSTLQTFLSLWSIRNDYSLVEDWSYKNSDSHSLKWYLGIPHWYLLQITFRSTLTWPSLGAMVQWTVETARKGWKHWN